MGTTFLLLEHNEMSVALASYLHPTQKSRPNGSELLLPPCILRHGRTNLPLRVVDVIVRVLARNVKKNFCARFEGGNFLR